MKMKPAYRRYMVLTEVEEYLKTLEGLDPMDVQDFFSELTGMSLPNGRTYWIIGSLHTRWPHVRDAVLREFSTDPERLYSLELQHV